jgi:hypothetical protein
MPQRGYLLLSASLRQRQGRTRLPPLSHVALAERVLGILPERYILRFFNAYLLS